MSAPHKFSKSKESCDKVRKKAPLCKDGRALRARGRLRCRGTRVRPARVESPFAKYRGIGNPGIPSGKKAIVQRIRELRGR